MFNLLERNSGYLFSSFDLSEAIPNSRQRMISEVESMDSNRLLNTASADLVRYLVEKYTIEAPALRRDQWVASGEEVQIDVSHDQNRYIRDRSRPALVPGQRIEVEVPISGEVELLYARASQRTTSPPRAELRGRSIFLRFEIPHGVAERNLRAETDRVLDDIEIHLSWVRSDLSPYNQGLEKEAERVISARRERILSNQGRVASLGIPLKARSDAPVTYAVPNVRRKAVPTLPTATSAAFEPEPVLDMDTYEHILRVVQNMALVMERSPGSFKTMVEEDIRQHFLVQLNGQFEGAATGETFNVSGKTDILLRAKGKNVFIAECKFWKGPKHFSETIDQLLRYAAWRDTKTAILVFNRGVAMTTVLEGVRAEVEKHGNFKRSITWTHESGSRHVLHHTSDRNREFFMTVLVFDVPG